MARKAGAKGPDPKEKAITATLISVLVALATVGGFLLYSGFSGESAPLPDTADDFSVSSTDGGGPTEAHVPYLPGDECMCEDALAGSDPGDGHDSGDAECVCEAPTGVPFDEDYDPLDPENGALVTPETMREGTVFIPSIGAYAPITTTGEFDERQDLLLPKNPRILGRWAESSDLSATEGDTLLSGHITFGPDRGALYLLGSVEPGARAYLKGADGNVQSFIAIDKQSVKKDELPQSIWENDSKERTLTVVTCGGEVEQTPQGRVFSENQIVTFALAT